MQVRRGKWDRKPVDRRYRDALSAIDWRDFERLIADYYRDQGFDVQHDGTGGRGVVFDGGVDIRLRKDGKLTLVQCKHENAFQTEHNAVNELLGIKVNEGADEAIVITSGEFTTAAKRFGSQGHVRLVDGVDLRRMLGSRLDALGPAAPSPLQTAAERLAWEAVDRIASGGRRRRGARAIEATFQATLAKAALAVIGFLLFVLVGLPLLQKTLVSALTPPQTPRTERQVVAPAQVHVKQPASRPLPVIVPAPPLTAAERARAKQQQAERDAEVQRYLERVPEVTHYRYSPLDQNRDRPTESSQPTPDPR